MGPVFARSWADLLMSARFYAPAVGGG
jgi:hypothetical protein